LTESFDCGLDTSITGTADDGSQWPYLPRERYTDFYTNGPNVNRIKSVQNPDGTMTLYQYVQAADGSQTNTVATGAPDSTGSNIVDGTTNVTVLGPLGQMVSQTSIDARSGIVLVQDVWTNYDQFARPQQVTHLDGTTELTSYDCCGIATTTDRDGVVTAYTYDAMKRPIATTRWVSPR